MGLFDDLLENPKFLTAAGLSLTAYFLLNDKANTISLLHNQKIEFSIVAATFLIGWQLGGSFSKKYIKDRVIYENYKNNGSYPNFKNTDFSNVRFTPYDKVAEHFNAELNDFYLNNFRFSNIIKRNLNFVNRYLANKAEKRDLFYSWEALKGGKNLIIGSSGAGKSVFLTNILYQWLLTQRRAVIYDIKGEFTSYFYNQDTDYILNFDDERGFYWDFFEDIENGLKANLVIQFFDALFKALVTKTNDEFWQNSAAKKFKEILKNVLYDETIATEEKMNKFVEKIFEYLEEVKSGNNRLKQSIAATLEININLFAKNAMLSKKRKKFLITDFFQKQNTKLFLHNFQVNANELTPFLTAFLTILLKYQLTFFEKCDEKDYTLYLIDEYLTFYTLFDKRFREDVHNLARSKGILLLPAIQYLPQQKEAGALFANIENLFIFKLDEIETIKKVQELVGKVQIKTAERTKKKLLDESLRQINTNETYLIDANMLKTLKKGEHFTYILSQAILYKAYVQYTSFKEINKTYLEDKTLDEEFYHYIKERKENAKISSNF